MGFSGNSDGVFFACFPGVFRGVFSGGFRDPFPGGSGIRDGMRSGGSDRSGDRWITLGPFNALGIDRWIDGMR